MWSELGDKKWGVGIWTFCHDSMTTEQDAVTKFYRSVAEIKMKAKVKDGCGPSKGARSRA